ncbi:LysR family transcriptional regulator [Serratia marcescens]|uniref:LysR family transcriptional regulator n=1 Tax=Serratia TaxID=613 RepID=UPI0009762FD5|nr:MULTISPECIES: LysR family transcriptional regulator [Serratia]ASC78138.1 LysR family transcriptional regulator [Serratia marcescens]EIT7184197.1 LysR family transcriptional regulator [Serratia marcescens]EJC6393025.1 LysR family transcriptional regulator [Serratia marcescens]NVC32637.1 LysR family transcriptional regulator [Serratia marcescens]NVC44372.1 LysR family transcriptional regulator [Serratia marcescens]
MLRANLNDIQVFMAVVDAGSFVAGGQTMGLSRSAAGKAIARLEQRLSVRLLHRTTRSLGLTDEGREFYRRGLQILASVDDAEASVAGDKGTARGVLRLTAPAAFGRRILLPLVPKFLVAWPEVQVEISFSDRLADIVEEGFDLAVRIGVTAPDTRLVSRTLARYRALLCASPAYLAARGEPLTVESLAGHEALLFSSCNQKQPWRLRDERGEWVKAPVRGRLRLDSGEALRDAALSGLGIAYLPEFMIAEDLAAGRLQQVLRAVAGEEVRIVALYPNKRLLEPRVRRFLDLLVDTLGG